MSIALFKKARDLITENNGDWEFAEGTKIHRVLPKNHCIPVYIYWKHHLNKVSILSLVKQVYLQAECWQDYVYNKALKYLYTTLKWLQTPWIKQFLSRHIQTSITCDEKSIRQTDLHKLNLAVVSRLIKQELNNYC